MRTYPCDLGYGQNARATILTANSFDFLQLLHAHTFEMTLPSLCIDRLSGKTVLNPEPFTQYRLSKWIVLEL